MGSLGSVKSVLVLEAVPRVWAYSGEARNVCLQKEDSRDSQNVRAKATMYYS